MKCFNHRESSSVAICKSCGRGLCEDCLVEIGKGVACKNSCEEDVAALNELVERGKGAYQKTGSVYYRNAIFILLLGVGLLLFGLIGDLGGSGLFFIGMGGLFIAWSFAQFQTAKKFTEK